MAPLGALHLAVPVPAPSLVPDVVHAPPLSSTAIAAYGVERQNHYIQAIVTCAQRWSVQTVLHVGVGFPLDV